ncbi:MAG: hypothetical protein ACR2PO_18515 [Methyloligellaceae bacterium]
MRFETTLRQGVIGAAVAVLLIACGPGRFAAQGQSADPHKLFADHCGRCHGHAGPFAREHLELENGEVIGRKSRVPVRTYLPTHFGKPSKAAIDVLVETFQLQLARGGLYQDRCTICHVQAKKLARTKLIIRDGRLIGRYTGADMKTFLSGHGRLTAEEAAMVEQMLRWQLAR